MMDVTYAGSTFLTTDQAAITLLEYVATMDRYGSAERVEVPFVAADGTWNIALLLVWAGGEVICFPHPQDEADPELDVSAMSARADSRRAFRRAAPSNDVIRTPDNEIFEL